MQLENSSIVRQFAAPGPNLSPCRSAIPWIVVAALCLPGCSEYRSSHQSENNKANDTVESPPASENVESSPVAPIPLTESSPASQKSAPMNGEPVSSTSTTAPNTSPSNTTVSTSRNAGAPSSTPAESDPKAASPETALSQARSLQRRAVTEKANGKPGKAFELASKAWEVVHDFPGDANCQQLTRELESELEELGKEANSKSGRKAADLSKTLIEK